MSQVTGVLLILCLYSTAVISDIYKETSYYGDKVKSGTCPVPPERCPKPPRLDGVCTKDSQCPGEKKCCVRACEYACLDPQNVVKSGSCPHVGPPGTKIGIVCTSINTTACTNDVDCKGQQKCCNVLCTNKCRDPVDVSAIVKSGTCPVPPERCLLPPKLDGVCTKDSQCPGEEKCCVHACEYACLDLKNIVKSGNCPHVGPPGTKIGIVCTSINKTTCANDVDCKGQQKCCNELCTNKCRDPVDDSAIVGKSGNCPHVGPPGTKIGIVCTSINKTTCANDVDCKGQQKCCNELCTNKCRDPVDDSAIVEKSGYCPHVGPPGTMLYKCFSVNKTACKNDGDCKGRQKCCSEACINKCRDPVAKPILVPAKP